MTLVESMTWNIGICDNRLRFDVEEAEEITHLVNCLGIASIAP